MHYPILPTAYMLFRELKFNQLLKISATFSIDPELQSQPEFIWNGMLLFAFSLSANSPADFSNRV